MSAFLITIDTEGDDAWSRPRTATTRNAAFLPRFQSLCERHALRPTYLTNYEMCRSDTFREFARDALRRDAAEVGLHLHAWDSPPLVPLTSDDAAHHPYLIEFPQDLMRRKIRVLTDLLEQTFERKMVSHRAGRWGINEAYARALVEHGYRVDCSVTPLISWQGSMGDPGGKGGPDFTSFPHEPYFIDLNDISRPGDSPLLEVPLSVIAPRSGLARRLHRWFRGGPRLVRGPLYRLAPPVRKLVPNGRNLRQLLQIVRRAAGERWAHIEFALHSSELMPGGSPRFTTRGDIERLYEHLDELFQTAVAHGFTGATLDEFHARMVAGRRRAPAKVPHADAAAPAPCVVGT
jgi:hypothetical protein